MLSLVGVRRGDDLSAKGTSHNSVHLSSSPLERGSHQDGDPPEFLINTCYIKSGHTRLTYDEIKQISHLNKNCQGKKKNAHDICLQMKLFTILLKG